MVLPTTFTAIDREHGIAITHSPLSMAIFRFVGIVSHLAPITQPTALASARTNEDHRA